MAWALHNEQTNASCDQDTAARDHRRTSSNESLLMRNLRAAFCVRAFD
jgi:hypothetical protein